MSSNNLVHVVGGTQIYIGLSAIVKVAASANQRQIHFRNDSAGNCEIVPIPVALEGASAAGWGLGYLLGTGEIINMTTAWGPATYYLAASGSTGILSAIVGYGPGATIP